MHCVIRMNASKGWCIINIIKLVLLAPNSPIHSDARCTSSQDSIHLTYAHVFIFLIPSCGSSASCMRAKAKQKELQDNAYPKLL